MMNKQNLILVFDVETTGLIPKRGLENIELCPYILQLSFIVYDTNKSEIKRKFNSYVNINDGIDVTPKITELTGITKETCKMLGKPIEYVLTEFYNEYQSCDVIVAHNIEFDKEMISIEVIRNYSKMVENGCLYPSLLFNRIYDNVNHKEIYCTMKNGKKFCDLWTGGSTNELSTKTNIRRYQKNPKLSELYYKIFNTIPTGLHDAQVDTDVCLKCYIHLRTIIIESVQD